MWYWIFCSPCLWIFTVKFDCSFVRVVSFPRLTNRKGGKTSQTFLLGTKSVSLGMRLLSGLPWCITSETLADYYTLISFSQTVTDRYCAQWRSQSPLGRMFLTREERRENFVSIIVGVVNLFLGVSWSVLLVFLMSVLLFLYWSNSSERTSLISMPGNSLIQNVWAFAWAQISEGSLGIYAQASRYHHTLATTVQPIFTHWQRYCMGGGGRGNWAPSTL